MVKTVSTMLPLGTQAPHFCLPDVVSGQLVAFEDKQPHTATVVMFICNHCPYVKHIIATVVSLATEYRSKGIRWIAINANDISQYPDDAPEHMKTLALEQGYPFPYLFDETQETAQAYHAACTPDFFVFNQQESLVYRGQFDDARPGNAVPVTGNSLQHAMDRLLANNKAPMEEQKPSLGCNIKWKE